MTIARAIRELEPLTYGPSAWASSAAPAAAVGVVMVPGLRLPLVRLGQVACLANADPNAEDAKAVKSKKNKSMAD